MIKLVSCFSLPSLPWNRCRLENKGFRYKLATHYPQHKDNHVLLLFALAVLTRLDAMNSISSYGISIYSLFCIQMRKSINYHIQKQKVFYFAEITLLFYSFSFFFCKRFLDINRLSDLCVSLLSIDCWPCRAIFDSSVSVHFYVLFGNYTVREWYYEESSANKI